MIKLNTVYKAGKQEVKFQEKESGIIFAEYGDESIEGKIEGNTLKGIFHNKKVNVTGLMELTFHETGFDGRWKKGIEPGELKQKWNAVLVEDKNPTNESKNGYHIFTDEDNIRYEGEWENDEFISGIAEYVDEDGEKVIEEGEFKDFTITSGKITYQNGMVEEGSFDEEGMLHGQGKQTYFDEDEGQVIEEGIFKHNILKEGKITWADGSWATGLFDEDLELNGTGIYTWANGDFQDGTWVHGEFNEGKVRITHDDGEISAGMMKNGEWVEEEIVNIITNGIEDYENGSKYEGEFLNGIRHGNGKYYWATGQLYEGEFSDGNFNGNGIKSYPNGDYKSGFWKDDEFQTGKIKVTYNSGDFYEGDFLNGIRNGNGKYYWATGQLYEGEFSEGNFNGNGIKSYPNGDYKSGFWKDDEFQTGKIKVTYNSGDFYEGEFLNRMRHGIGKYTWKEGGEYEGGFIKGDFNGEGIKSYPNGDYKKGIWKDDVLYEGESQETIENVGVHLSNYKNGLLQKETVLTTDIWDEKLTINKLFFYENNLLVKKEEEEINSKGEIDIWILNFKYENEILIQEDSIWINAKNEKDQLIENYKYENEKLIQKESFRISNNGDETKYFYYYHNGKLTNKKTIYHCGDWTEVIFIKSINEDLEEVTINYSDGREFKGIYDNDNVCYYEGKLSFKNGDYKSGIWDQESELISGFIRETNDNGDIFEGNFNRVGHSKCFFKNGDFYEGEYLLENFHGWGKLTKSNGEIIEGKWERGEIIFSIGDTVTLKSGDINMTIESVSGNSAKCMYVYRGKPKSEFYDFAMLKHLKN